MRTEQVQKINKFGMKVSPFLQQGSALVRQSETIDIAFEASEAVLKTASIELPILIPVLFTPTREDQITDTIIPVSVIKSRNAQIRVINLLERTT